MKSYRPREEGRRLSDTDRVAVVSFVNLCPIEGRVGDIEFGSGRTGWALPFSLIDHRCEGFYWEESEFLLFKGEEKYKSACPIYWS